MQKFIQQIALSFLLAFASFGATAAGSATGLVIGYYAAQNGIMLVYPSVSLTTPSCSQTGRFAIDTSTETGKQQANAIRFAFALGRTVSMYGAGTCSSAFTDTENVVSVYVSQ
jgi:hypothetical protein